MHPRHLLVALACVQQVAPLWGALDLAQVFYVFQDPRANLLEHCNPQAPPDNHFDQQCLILRIFNRTQVDQMDEEANFGLARDCACHLSRMRDLWDAYDDQSLRRLQNIVRNAEDYAEMGWDQYPDWLWSDVDVTIHQVSIFTATRDYFYLRSNNKNMSLPARLRRELEADEMWQLTERICWRIAEDSHGLYRYTENLNRLNPVIFFGFVKLFESINALYTASKACKVLLLLRLPEYKLKPDDADYIPVYQNIGAPDSGVHYDLDEQLTAPSMHLHRCNIWTQTVPKSIESLLQECPMIALDRVPTDWLLQHPTALERAEVALKCGCHLLEHSETWNLLMRDPNVSVMASAITGYMNRNPMPNFATSPIWTIFAWFEETMRKFMNRQFSIEQLLIVQRRSEVPFEAERNQNKKDALELLRRGCNYIVFNHNRNVILKPALKIIKYLDNLREISQDSTFVFHLTLKDVNLFKLYALSKMCKSVI